MAHRTNKVTLGVNVGVALVTFTSYTAGQGGEAFTLAEFGLSGTLQSIFFLGTSGVGNPEVQCKFIPGTGKVMLLDPGGVGRRIRNPGSR